MRNEKLFIDSNWKNPLAWAPETRKVIENIAFSDVPQPEKFRSLVKYIQELNPTLRFFRETIPTVMKDVWSEETLATVAQLFNHGAAAPPGLHDLIDKGPGAWGSTENLGR